MTSVRLTSRFGLIALVAALATACIYDPWKAQKKALDRRCIPDRDAFLALDYQAFDQSFETPSEENPTAGGWRAIAKEEFCILPAADLIREWREENGEDIDASKYRYVLFWHEGQLRARVGRVNAAAVLFGRSKRPVETPYDEAWNAYAEASVAFLLKDRPRMDAVYRRMKAIPEPDDWAAAVAARERMAKENGVTFPPPRWPQNITVVERLIACFDGAYRDAYFGTCHTELSSATGP